MDTGDNPLGVFCGAAENPFSCTACWHVLHGQTDFRSDGILHISKNPGGFFSCLHVDHLLADLGIPKLISLLQLQRL